MRDDARRVCRAWTFSQLPRAEWDHWTTKREEFHAGADRDVHGACGAHDPPDTRERNSRLSWDPRWRPASYDVCRLDRHPIEGNHLGQIPRLSCPFSLVSSLRTVGKGTRKDPRDARRHATLGV